MRQMYLLALLYRPCLGQAEEAGVELASHQFKERGDDRCLDLRRASGDGVGLLEPSSRFAEGGEEPFDGGRGFRIVARLGWRVAVPAASTAERPCR